MVKIDRQINKQIDRKIYKDREIYVDSQNDRQIKR